MKPHVYFRLSIFKAESEQSSCWNLGVGIQPSRQRLNSSLIDVPFPHTQEQMLKERPWDVATLYLRHYEP
jgi:hypothetical protein